MRKYLLCRPEGGLNDMLCQIEKCCRYGEQTGRIVVVETHAASTGHFRDSLENYFESTQSRLVLRAEACLDDFKKFAAFPGSLSGRVDDYRLGYDHEAKRHVEEESRQPTTFDFSKDYPHPLLVHHQGGGGRISVFALLRMRLRQALADELVRRLAAIGGPYSAIHVRHTDLTTDYGSALAALKEIGAPGLFLATDNGSVLDAFRESLGYSRVLSFSRLDSAGGQPLHLLDAEGPEAFERNRDAILDLLMLALAERLHVLEVQNKPTGQYSGYSQLALDLFRSKVLLKHVLSAADIDFGLG